MASLPNRQLSRRVGYITCRPLNVEAVWPRKAPVSKGCAVLAVAALFEGSDTVRRYAAHRPCQDADAASQQSLGRKATGENGCGMTTSIRESNNANVSDAALHVLAQTYR
jgi:hypothetical protein